MHDIKPLPEPTVRPTNVRRPILKKSRERFPRTHLELKFTNTSQRFIQIRGQLGPSLGVIQGGATHLRRSNAPTFADRDPNYTLWAEDDAKERAWQWAKQLYRIRGDYFENEAKFFSPKMEWRVASVSKRQSRRKSLHCGFLCLHEELEAVKATRFPNDCDHGEWVDRHKPRRATVYVKDLDMFVTVQLLEDTPAVLSLGKTLRVKWVFT